MSPSLITIIIINVFTSNSPNEEICDKDTITKYKLFLIQCNRRKNTKKIDLNESESGHEIPGSFHSLQMSFFFFVTKQFVSKSDHLTMDSKPIPTN